MWAFERPLLENNAFDTTLWMMQTMELKNLFQTKPSQFLEGLAHSLHREGMKERERERERERARKRRMGEKQFDRTVSSNRPPLFWVPHGGRVPEKLLGRPHLLSQSKLQAVMFRRKTKRYAKVKENSRANLLLQWRHQRGSSACANASAELPGGVGRGGGRDLDGGAPVLDGPAVPWDEGGAACWLPCGVSWCNDGERGPGGGRS
jgi:hypothetical protein